MTAFGLLAHETQLSVLHFGVRKAAGLSEPLPNKAPLLLCSGLRCAALRPAALHWQDGCAAAVQGHTSGPHDSR